MLRELLLKLFSMHDESSPCLLLDGGFVGGGCAHVAHGGIHGAGVLALTSLSVEKVHVVRHNFGAKMFLTIVAFPAARFESPFDIDHRTFGQILAANFRQPS